MFLVATSYPFLNIFWDILIITAWFIFFWIAITVLIDVFRRHDISGWAKAAWVIFVVILPWIGVLVYLIVNHQGMADRKYQDAAAALHLLELVLVAAHRHVPATAPAAHHLHVVAADVAQVT